MKKKIFLFILLLMIVTSCGKKEEGNVTMQNLDIIEKDENGEIIKGTLEGYTFSETEEKTDRVKIQMKNGGVILIVLSNSATPITIKNFQDLVSEKFYDGIVFHRVVKDFMIQAGDPTGTGYSGSDKKIKGEFLANGVNNTLSHDRGVISMARASNDYNSASSQFFIMHSDKYKSSLDGNYAAFGRVFAGLSVVDELANVEVNGETPINKPVIKSIRFITIEKAS